MSAKDDRRAFPRLKVFGGNAEIKHIMGRRPPRERARIVDWSRGGVLLRVPSPRRRFLFLKAPPALALSDELHCTLRLPPQYQDIDIEAAVVRCERAKDDPDQLEVGLRFDATTRPAVIEAMAKLLEPRLRAPSVRAPRQGGESRRASKRVQRAASARVATIGADTAGEPRPERKSARVQAPGAEARKSARLGRPSGRAARP